MNTYVSDLGNSSWQVNKDCTGKLAAFPIFREIAGERSGRAESYNLGNWAPTADERIMGPNTTLSDGIYIVTVSDRTPEEWLGLSRKASIIALDQHPGDNFNPLYNYDAAIAVYRGRVVGGALARVSRHARYRWTPALKPNRMPYSFEELTGEVEMSADCPPFIPDSSLKTVPMVTTLWVHEGSRRLGLGRQIISAVAQHFKLEADQIAYRLPLSAEATLMFQAMGINQIICDI